MQRRIGEAQSSSQAFVPVPSSTAPPPSASETSLWWEWGQFSKQGICTLRIYGHLCEGCGKPQDRRAECSFESIHFSQRFVEKNTFYIKTNISLCRMCNWNRLLILKKKKTICLGHCVECCIVQGRCSIRWNTMDYWRMAITNASA